MLHLNIVRQARRYSMPKEVKEISYMKSLWTSRESNLSPPEWSSLIPAPLQLWLYETSACRSFEISAYQFLSCKDCQLLARARLLVFEFSAFRFSISLWSMTSDHLISYISLTFHKYFFNIAQLFVLYIGTSFYTIYW